MSSTWDALRGNEEDPGLWALFHENSKTHGWSGMPPDEAVAARMARLWEVLPYPQYPSFALPAATALPPTSIYDALVARRSTADLLPHPLAFETLATLLQLSYGVNRPGDAEANTRSLRTVPSGGALFPLEIYFHASHVERLRPGIYHFDPLRNEIQLLREGNHSAAIKEAMVQPEVVAGASLIVWITAIFERTVFKYGDRGYRFLLLEAGHVGQNLSLLASAVGLGCLNIGGYFDRRADEILQLDGVTQSTVYMAAIGALAQGER